MFILYFRVNLEVYIFCDSSVTLYCNSTQLSTIKNNHLSETLLWWSVSRQTCITVYVILTLSLIIVVFVRCNLFVSFFMKASTNLHNNMLNAIIRATMTFFNTNSSGNVNFKYCLYIYIICIYLVYKFDIQDDY